MQDHLDTLHVMGLIVCTSMPILLLFCCDETLPHVMSLLALGLTQYAASNYASLPALLHFAFVSCLGVMMCQMHTCMLK